MWTRDLVVALALGFGCSHSTAPVETAHEPSTTVTIGAKAPDGQLIRSSNTKVALADVLHEHAQTIVVFYRGFW